MLTPTQIQSAQSIINIFETSSVRCVKDYQAAKQLPATGVADISLVAQLAV